MQQLLSSLIDIPDRKTKRKLEPDHDVYIAD